MNFLIKGESFFLFALLLGHNLVFVLTFHV